MHLSLLKKQFLNKTQFLLKSCKPNKKAMFSSSKKPFTVIVEGNIGSGKTTFLKCFENNKNVLSLPEPVTEWKNIDGHDLLDLLYSDIESWAFLFQTYVQITMMKNHTLKTDKCVKLMERSLYSGRYVFAENLKNMSILTPVEVAVLDEWFKWLVQNENFSVDLIVYLKADPEVVYQRIKIRNRPEEKNISLDYLKKLHQCHEDWLSNKKFSCPAPIIVLDGNKNLDDIKQEYKCFQAQVKMLTTCEWF